METSSLRSALNGANSSDLEILERTLGVFSRWRLYLSGQTVKGACPRPLLRAHQDPSRGRIVRGANRSGKSTWAAHEIVWTCLGLHPYRESTPPVHAKIVAPTLPISMNEDHPQRDIFRAIVPACTLRGGRWEDAWDGRVFTLTFDNGSRVAFVSVEQSAATQTGSGGLGALWIDEECPRLHFEESLRAMVDTPGAFWVMTYWPQNRYPWIRELHDDALRSLRSGVRVFTVTARDNEHNLPAGEIDRWRLTMRPAEEKSRIGGEYASDEDLTFGGLTIPILDKTGRVVRQAQI